MSKNPDESWICCCCERGGRTNRISEVTSCYGGRIYKGTAELTERMKRQSGVKKVSAVKSYVGKLVILDVCPGTIFPFFFFVLSGRKEVECFVQET